MPDISYTQSNFNRGEIDDLLAARFDYDDYDKSLRRARNCVTLPQGGVSRRFGTTYVAQYAISNGDYIDVQPILYDNSATFVVVWYPQKFDVYIENTIFQSQTASGSPVYQAEDILRLNFSQVQERLIITHPNFPQRQLKLTAVTPTVAGFNATTDTLTTSSATVINNQIFPVTFVNTGGALPTTSPQIYAGTTYYGLGKSTTAFQIYETPVDAKAGTNVYQISSAGTGTNTISLYNSWVISDIAIRTYPAYDFSDGTYTAAGFTFTPSALDGTIGALITITASGAIFTASHVGGLLSGGGGVLRITHFTSTTVVEGYAIRPFTGTFDAVSGDYIVEAIPGALCFLGEPVWSAIRGYPRCSTTFQGRLFFAGTSSIVNGIWGSNVNSLYEFDDSESFPDNAISYYPASGNIAYIQAMTAARSLLVHTSAGSFSTALSTEQPLTPGNVSFIEQNKDGCSALQPIFIDNQVIYVDSSQNNVKNLIWELNQSSYVLRNISIVSSSLIRKPIDIASYSNPLFIDGSYALIVNGDGTLATFNTLYMESVAGWTLQNTGQWADATGVELIPNNFVNVATSFNQTWFIINRIVYTAGSTTDVIQVDSSNDSLLVNGIYASVPDQVWACDFTFGIIPPASIPRIEEGRRYYAREASTSNFVIYETWDDANNEVNPIRLVAFFSARITLFQPTSSMFLEQLNFNALMDCITQGSIVSNAFVPRAGAFPLSLTPYEGQWIYIYVNEGSIATADGVIPEGYALGPYQVLNGVICDTNGSPAVLPITTAASAYIGLPFQSLVEFLPINLPLGTGSNFYQQKLLRQIYVYYYQSVGFKINGYTVPIRTIATAPLGINNPIMPTTGIVNIPPMSGWTNLEQQIQITQDLPMPFTILGWGAVVEIVP